MKKIMICIAVLFFTASFLYYFGVRARASVVATQVYVVEQQIAQAKLKNQSIEREIATVQSLHYIRTIAQANGYTNLESTLSLEESRTTLALTSVVQ